MPRGDRKMLAGRRILLIVGGGIAAYKSLELVRLLRKAGVAVRADPDRGRRRVRHAAVAWRRWPATRSITDLFSLTDEAEMGHIELSRCADLVVVAPATADLMAKIGARPGQRPGLPPRCSPPTSRC